MSFLSRILENNLKWAQGVRQRDATFFTRLAHGQQPDCLWIGCSDSRVPSTQIVGLGPGEMFVHRNVANVVSSADSNAMSVLQYAVDVLEVDHIIVCGHYGCGGVKAVLGEMPAPPLGDWLKEILEVRRTHQQELDTLPDMDAKWRRLCELNVRAQVETLTNLAIVQNAWNRGQQMTIHGLIFDLETGRLVSNDVSIR